MKIVLPGRLRWRPIASLVAVIVVTLLAASVSIAATPTGLDLLMSEENGLSDGHQLHLTQSATLVSSPDFSQSSSTTIEVVFQDWGKWTAVGHGCHDFVSGTLKVFDNRECSGEPGLVRKTPDETLAPWAQLRNRDGMSDEELVQGHVGVDSNVLRLIDPTVLENVPGGPQNLVVHSTAGDAVCSELGHVCQDETAYHETLVVIDANTGVPLLKRVTLGDETLIDAVITSYEIVPIG